MRDCGRAMPLDPSETLISQSELEAFEQWTQPETWTVGPWLELTDDLYRGTARPQPSQQRQAERPR